MSVGLSLLLVVFFLAMNAFFVVAEFSMVRVRPSQVDILVDNGVRGAKNAKIITSDVNSYLGACQLGITLASLALGWLGEDAFASIAESLLGLTSIPLAAQIAIGGAIGFIILTTLHVVVGELIPKSFAIFSTERYVLFTATPLLWFYRITFPVMWLFNAITNAVVRLCGHNPADEHEVYTEEEIRLLIDESTESGLIDSEQNEFVDNIFDIAEKDASALMTPRTDMVCLDLSDSLEDNLKVVAEHKYTRYPVYRRDKDDIVGFVHIKDLYNLGPNSTMADVEGFMRMVVAAPEGMSVTKLLQLLKREKTKLAIVVDEHGGTSGLVTMGDIFEEIVGDFDDEYIHGDGDDIVEIAPGHYKTVGLCPIDDFAEKVGLGKERFEDSSFETLAGLLLELFDRIPAAGDTVSFVEGSIVVDFTVVSMDVRRIDEVDFTVSCQE